MTTDTGIKNMPDTVEMPQTVASTDPAPTAGLQLTSPANFFACLERPIFIENITVSDTMLEDETFYTLSFGKGSDSWFSQTIFGKYPEGKADTPSQVMWDMPVWLTANRITFDIEYTLAFVKMPDAQFSYYVRGQDFHNRLRFRDHGSGLPIPDKTFSGKYNFIEFSDSPVHSYRLGLNWWTTSMTANGRYPAPGISEHIFINNGVVDPMVNMPRGKLEFRVYQPYRPTILQPKSFNIIVTARLVDIKIDGAYVDPRSRFLPIEGSPIDYAI